MGILVKASHEHSKDFSMRHAKHIQGIEPSKARVKLLRVQRFLGEEGGELGN